MQAQETKRKTFSRRPAVEKRTGYTKSTIYRLMAEGLFPRPVKLAGGRAVAWDDDSIDEHLQALLDERDGVRPRPATMLSPADVIRLYDEAETHTEFMRVSNALSAIPSSFLSDDDRGNIASAMIAAVARLKVVR